MYEGDETRESGGNRRPKLRPKTARHLRRLRHPLSTCRLTSRWQEYMASLRSLYVADDSGDEGWCWKFFEDI